MKEKEIIYYICYHTTKGNKIKEFASIEKAKGFASKRTVFYIIESIINFEDRTQERKYIYKNPVFC